MTRSLARNDRKRDVEDAVPYGVQQSYGDGGTPSPTTAHRTRPLGGDTHTSPRRTNAHFAAGHMGPALQGTPVMQDGTSRTPSPTTVHRAHPQGTMPTHRPAGQMRILRRDTWVPPYRVRRSCRTGRRDAVPYNGSSHPSVGGDAHIAPSNKCAFCGGTHGSRPTGYAGHAGRDVGDAVPYNGLSYPSVGGDAHIAPPTTQRGRRKRLPACRKSPDGLFRQAGRQNRKIKTTFYFAILVAAAGDWTRKGTLTVPFHTILPSDICGRTGSLTG